MSNNSNFDLPLNASVNGNRIFHKANHDDRGYPHQNYIEKVPQTTFYTTESNGSSHVNKFQKIATINYLENSNVKLRYKLKFFELNYGDEHVVDIVVSSSSTGIYNSIISHAGKNNLVFYGIESDVNGVTKKLDLYVKSTQDWTYYFFRLEYARASNYFTAYPDSYAYKNIILLTSTSYLDSIISNINETIKERPIIRLPTSSLIVAVSAGANASLYLSVLGITANCVMTVTPNVKIPGELTYSTCISANDQVLVTISNSASYEKDFPACTWNIEYRSLI